MSDNVNDAADAEADGEASEGKAEANEKLGARVGGCCAAAADGDDDDEDDAGGVMAKENGVA